MKTRSGTKELTTEELSRLENTILRRILRYIDDYCGKNDIAIPTNEDFEILATIDELKNLVNG